MERRIVETGDGSHSLYVPELDEQYHSRHGALQESLHVFIDKGWNQRPEAEVLRILEIGFGTGLNALLTRLGADEDQQQVLYTGVEAYPLSVEEAASLNYTGMIGLPDHLLLDLHACQWSQDIRISDHFTLHKMEDRIESFSLEEPVHLIYFDAFAPGKQPELWTEDIFRRMYDMSLPGGLLTTYCAKGAVRRAMQAAGWEVERTPGPPGKREMLVARKL